jgi:hypothetical protein
MTGLALTLGALPALTGAMTGTAAISARADDVTASQDLMRNGWDSGEPNMGPSVVPTFTQLFDTPVCGQVYAQPLVVGHGGRGHRKRLGLRAGRRHRRGELVHPYRDRLEHHQVACAKAGQLR